MSKKKRPARPAARSSKREKFEQAGKFPLKKAAIVAAVVAVLAAGTVVGIVALGGSPKAGGALVSAGGVSYGDTPVNMSLLGSDENGDPTNVTLSLAEVKTKKIGGLVYSRSTAMPAGYDFLQGNGLPVLAYVAPSGRLVVATSLCEPCRSYDFHIEGSQLVCNTCFTRWDLNTLSGVDGGCLSYPPKELSFAIQGDAIQIPKTELEAWTPRI
jgi:hypothetical protein